MAETKVYEIEFFMKKYDKADDADRIVISYASDDIMNDMVTLMNTGIAAQHGEYTYFYPSHMIEFARVKIT